MSVEQFIVCDGCGCDGWDAAEQVLNERVHQARKRLRDKGWKTGLRGGQDLCDYCAEVGRKPRPETSALPNGEEK